jgi:hypothetical protein
LKSNVPTPIVAVIIVVVVLVAGFFFWQRANSSTTSVEAAVIDVNKGKPKVEPLSPDVATQGGALRGKRGG